MHILKYKICYQKMVYVNSYTVPIMRTIFSVTLCMTFVNVKYYHYDVMSSDLSILPVYNIS